MAGTDDGKGRETDKTDRRAAWALIAAYHQAGLRTLLEHVRTGFAQLDTGAIDEFEPDDPHPPLQAIVLWKFCGRAAASGFRLPTL